MATNYWAKFANLADATVIRGTGIPQRIAISQSDFGRLNSNNFANLVIFGPVTPEIIRGYKLLTFATKSVYRVKYLRMFLTDLYQIFRFSRHKGRNE